MGVEDRDWWKDAQDKREAANAPRPGRFGKAASNTLQPAGVDQALPRSLKWGPLGIVIFWLVIMATVYFAIEHVTQPRRVTVSLAGDVAIPRARDGHFYVAGTVAGKPVTFLVDTGASHVTVSRQLAYEAGLGPGTPTRFRTANGVIEGRIVADVPVSVGPAKVSGVRVAVGLVGIDGDTALLGQSFLSRFQITLTRNEMVLKPL
jgi:aspartyl protease family protein